MSVAHCVWNHTLSIRLWHAAHPLTRGDVESMWDSVAHKVTTFAEKSSEIDIT